MLAEADMGMTRMAMDPNSEDRCFAQFYKKAKQNPAKTKEAGRPIFDDCDYVMIMVPGDKDNIVRRPMREQDKLRFPKQWAAYEAGKDQAQDGTPLEEWPLLTRSQVEELKFFGVHTVEALAVMPDSNAQNFMGLNKLRQKAKDHLEAAKSDAPLVALREENERQAEEIELLKQQMGELIAEQKKPTRRRKAAGE